MVADYQDPAEHEGTLRALGAQRMDTRTRVPRCPQDVHHGLMYQESLSDGSEWVCRICGRRLYLSPPPAEKVRAKSGAIRSRVKALLACGFTVGAIARMVDRPLDGVQRLARQIAAEKGG